MPPLTEILEQQSVSIMECTIPPGMTVGEWRVRRVRRQTRSLSPIRRRQRSGRGGAANPNG